MMFDHNLFSTRYWAPGVIPFQFAEKAESCESLVAMFEKHGGGQIVGPHGSGKSTLVESLKKVFQQKGYAVRHVVLNDRNRRLPKDFWTEPFRQQGVRIIDGFEQLSFGQRLRLCWKFPGRLILVTHRLVGRLPVLYQTAPQFEVFAELVRRLGGTYDVAELRHLFETTHGNFRYAFMTLYDRESELAASAHLA